MLKLPYLSPSSIQLFKQDIEQFYIRYASKRPRDPQTDAMAVGSAFDAFIKAELGDIDFETVFKSQVEEQWHTEARTWGEGVFNMYRDTGALEDLKADFLTCGGHDVCLEVEGDITRLVGREGLWELDGVGVPYVDGLSDTRKTLAETETVPLRGKPDIVFSGANGHGILDWKVNGYHSKWGASPKTGYLRIRGGRHHGEHHKNVIPVKWGDIIIGGELQHVDLGWAQQLAIYGWLSGFPVGEEFLVCIDQLIYRKGNGRVAEFRCVIGGAWQLGFFNEICKIWEIVNSDHVFRDMSKEESQGREEVLSASLPVDDDFSNLLGA